MGESGKIKTWLLATIVVWPLAFGILVGVGCAIGANACPFGSEEPFTTTVGSEIWIARCALCHGIDGTGSPENPRAPDLTSGESATLDLATLLNRIERGSLGLMPRFKSQLSPEQIRAVAGYVIELRGGTDE